MLVISIFTGSYVCLFFPSRTKFKSWNPIWLFVSKCLFFQKCIIKSIVIVHWVYWDNMYITYYKLSLKRIYTEKCREKMWSWKKYLTVETVIGKIKTENWFLIVLFADTVTFWMSICRNSLKKKVLIPIYLIESSDFCSENNSSTRECKKEEFTFQSK